MASRSFIRRHPVVMVLLGLLLLLVLGLGWVYFRNNNGKGLLPTLADKGKEMLPTLENTSLAISNITADSLKAQVKMDVRNNMPMTLRIDSFRYQTRVDGMLLSQGAKNRPTVLQGDSVNHMQLPLAMDMSKLKNKVKTSQQDCVDVQLALELYTRLPVAGAQRIPVEITKRVYMPKMPKIEVADVDLKDIGLKNGVAVISLRITNYNPFPVTLNRVSYTFQISDDMQVQGIEEKDVSFRKRGTELMPIRVKFEPKGLPKVAFKTLFRAEKTPYKLDGAAVVAAGKHNPNDMTMRFNSTGTLQDLKEIPRKGE